MNDTPPLRAAPETSGGHVYWFPEVKDGHLRAKRGILDGGTHPRDWHQALPETSESLEASEEKNSSYSPQNCIACIQLKL